MKDSVDPLHVKNHKVFITLSFLIHKFQLFKHKRPECKVVYAPAKVKVKYPEANLMIAEQTFAWMGMLINENLFVLKKFQDGSRKS